MQHGGGAFRVEAIAQLTGEDFQGFGVHSGICWRNGNLPVYLLQIQRSGLLFFPQCIQGDLENLIGIGIQHLVQGILEVHQVTGGTLVDYQGLADTGGIVHIGGLSFQPVAGGSINAPQTVIEGKQSLLDGIRIHNLGQENRRLGALQRSADSLGNVPAEGGFGGNGEGVLLQREHHILLLR